MDILRKVSEVKKRRIEEKEEYADMHRAFSEKFAEFLKTRFLNDKGEIEPEKLRAILEMKKKDRRRYKGEKKDYCDAFYPVVYYYTTGKEIPMERPLTEKELLSMNPHANELALVLSRQIIDMSGSESWGYPHEYKVDKKFFKKIKDEFFRWVMESMKPGERAEFFRRINYSDEAVKKRAKAG